MSHDFQECPVFSAGEAGVVQYRIPALVTSAHGVLIAVCDARVDRPGDAPNNIDLVMKRSSDNGRTWGPMGRIAVFPGDEAACDPSLLVDRDTGAIWLFYDYAIPQGGLPHDRKVMFHVKRSDDGENWSEPVDMTSQLVPTDWWYLAVGPGAGIQTRDGRLVVPVYPVPKEDPPHVRMLYSDDHGATWTLGRPAGEHVGESQVVELSNGDLMVTMRKSGSRGCRMVAVSRDRGETWSGFRDEPQLIDPACQASILGFTSTGDGQDRDRILFANAADAEKRQNMTVRLSYDNGRTWPVSRLVHPDRSMYSCMAVLPDGRVGLLYEKNNLIAFASFGLEWLTHGQEP